MARTVAAEITNERFREMYEGDDDYENDNLQDNNGLIDLGFGGDADYDDDDDDNDFGAGGDYLDNDGENDNGPPSRSMKTTSGTSTTLEHFDRVFSSNNMYGGADNVVHNSDSDNKHATFEELCRLHLKEFSKGAEKYAVETQLSKRVSEWQSKLSNVLAEEEDRPEFDINAYIQRIIGVSQKCLIKGRVGGDKKKTIPFREITKNKDVFDVSRTFLTTLMLCNTENIAFCNEGNGEVSKAESLEVKLLKSDIDSPMDNFLAPSVMSQLE